MIEFEKYFAGADKIKKHNEEIKPVWESYRAGKPLRVPVVGGILPYKVLYLDESLSLKEYHTNPEEMLRINARARFYTDNIITSDESRNLNQEIIAGLPFLTYLEPAYWGCPVKYEERIQPNQPHMYDQVKADPDEMKVPDPFKDNIMPMAYDYYRKTKELVAKGYQAYGYTYSKAVGIGCMLHTIGIFNTATQLRGTDIFLDLYEDPDYVKKLLNKIADGYVKRSNAWLRLGMENGDYNYPEGILLPDKKIIRSIIWDHGIDMISMQLYKEFLVPVYERIKEEFSQDVYDTVIEHCGHGEEVIRFKHKYFGVNKFTNIATSFLDVEKLRHDLGDDVEMTMTIGPEALLNGPVERIIKEVKEALRPEIKRKGNLTFYVQASTNYTAPVRHMITLYEAVKEYGHY